jgi:preprotein translocase subunit SecG
LNKSGYTFSIYIALCVAVSLVSAAFMSDHTGMDISMEYDGNNRAGSEAGQPFLGARGAGGEG